ncbi:C40 family peptidase [Candidatus Puniceispirillum sp.]|nr:C40 family peptidase [Candidatus Puniceispirillum sp.]
MALFRIITPSAALRSGSFVNAALDSECLFGEPFEAEQSENGFTFGRLASDGYRGWIPDHCLGELPAPNARVIAPMSNVTSQADIKSVGRFVLSLGALVTITSLHDDRAKIITSDGTGFLPHQHLLPLASPGAGDTLGGHVLGDVTRVDDWVAIAEKLVGSPYKWGGRCAWGLDCSALVQLALAAGGIDAPRNSGPQHQIGNGIGGLSQLQRGDLVFWHGHVGIMQDGKTLLHANAHHMAVASEPLDDAIARIAITNGPVTALRRPMADQA